MLQICFWFAWLLVGFVGWNSWLAKACPPGACSGMLVAMQIGSLGLPVLLWLGLGIGISVALATRNTNRDADVPVRGNPPAMQAGADEKPDGPARMEDAS